MSSSLGHVSSTGLNTAVIVPLRMIGSIKATVTPQEQGEDELEITEQPVAQGADFTDHAFKLPARLMLQVGWSAGDAAAAGDPNYLQGVYDKLLNLQLSRSPFIVYTGKRVYTSMLLKLIKLGTDPETENVLLLTLTFKQVVIVSAVITTVSTDMTVQAAPEETAPVVSTGTKQLGAAPNYGAVLRPPTPSLGP